MSTETRNNSKILIAIIIILIAGIGIAAYFIFNQRTQIEELQEVSSLNKQQLEDEYENISMQYEGFKMNIKNDSLLLKLTNEQAKVQRLLDELRTVKAENKAEINRLNQELGTLRKILKSYITQIDSLNKANEQLRKANQEITNKYQETSRTLNEVTQEKANLTEKVTRAAKLDATGISIQATNKKGKVQKKINKVEQLVLNFLITKNITAEPGERTIYVRIMKPDNDVLTKNQANVFPFENKEINYSMKKVIEYGGEETPVTMYWIVEEFLMPGTYRADIFADGNRIGSRSFTLQN
ncbi:hypothetical protein [Dysgonomonas sp. 511]|uniref:hypothetical protein n=1 Tax=Dysgonomonas sp. 511 TaxID=2302930 RepID=UPI0013D5DD49|nr:hypothetical protein [Dysgonomonas sp. 511]NDV79531.1 hypothetical protein [Dysgonomonas sp. 511]